MNTLMQPTKMPSTCVQIWFCFGAAAKSPPLMMTKKSGQIPPLGIQQSH